MGTHKIWTELSDHLLNFIISKVNVKEDAEDILVDVFEKVHLNIDKLKDESKIKSWVFTIARNAINDYYKKKKPLDTNAEVTEAESEIANEEELLNKLQQCMVNMIAELPEKYQGPLRMGELDGKSQQEVADAYGLSLPGAKSRIQRGRKILKDMLIDCCKIDVNERRQIKAGSANEMDCSC